QPLLQPQLVQPPMSLISAGGWPRSPASQLAQPAWTTAPSASTTAGAPAGEAPTGTVSARAATPHTAMHKRAAVAQPRKPPPDSLNSLPLMIGVLLPT